MVALAHLNVGCLLLFRDLQFKKTQWSFIIVVSGEQPEKIVKHPGPEGQDFHVRLKRGCKWKRNGRN